MMRAVLGGSFDPVHNGHLALVERVLASGLAERVHIVPAAQNPLKTGCHEDWDHRLNMVRLAFAGLVQTRVETLEGDRPGPSFTVDTLDALALRYPRDTFRLLVGADNLATFPSWKSVDRILELARLVVFSRREAGRGQASVPPEDFPGGKVLFVEDFQVEVSSTRIRAMLAADKAVADFLPPDVAQYITTHQLYRN